MRYLIYSDLHANHTAFESLISMTSSTIHLFADQQRCLGDIFGYGAQHEKILAESWRDTQIRLGNHDKYLFEALHGNWDWHKSVNLEVTMTIFRHYKSIMDDPLLKDRFVNILDGADLRILPHEEVVEGYRLVFVHGTPHRNIESSTTNHHFEDYLYPYRKAEDLGKIERVLQQYMDTEDRVLIFVGHTHHPMLTGIVDNRIVFFDAAYSTDDQDHPIDLTNEKYPRVLLINGGSVGQPRVGGGAIAHAVHFNAQEKKLRFVRHSYNPSESIELLENWGFPDADLEALGKIIGSNITDKDWKHVQGRLSEMLRCGLPTSEKSYYLYDRNGFYVKS
jgi:hypothetical protein